MGQCVISIILKDIALDAFESFNAKLKNDGKDGNWFTSLRL
ncbi:MULTISPECIES: hypothetical protein [Bartonella]|nr:MULTISPECIES: hypothetical protein [Bartonella]